MSIGFTALDQLWYSGDSGVCRRGVPVFLLCWGAEAETSRRKNGLCCTIPKHSVVPPARLEYGKFDTKVCGEMCAKNIANCAAQWEGRGLAPFLDDDDDGFGALNRSCFVQIGLDVSAANYSYLL
jgi:hypothetical protein